jgi:hypothetical protein
LKPPKRKSSGSAKRPRTDDDGDSDDGKNVIWTDIPTEVQSGIVETIQRALKNRSSKSRKKSSGTRDDLETFAHGLRLELLPFYSQSLSDLDDPSLFDTDEIVACFSGNERRSGKGVKAAMNPQQNLELWAASTFRLIQKAVKVYRMLDVTGKGCVVPEDVYRAINELQVVGNVSSVVSRKDSATTFDDVLAMMAEFASCPASFTDETEVVLSCHDIIRIARLVNL